MTTCLVGLGSNLGDRAALLDRAVELLRASPHIEHLASSRWHETSPIGGRGGQGEYLNGAVRFETALQPAALLARLHDLEAQLGRQRGERWQARTVDLDLLLFGDRVIHSPELTVPHPRMAVRRFVLGPAAEIAGPMVHPQIGWSVARLLAHLQFAYPYLALTGAQPSEKSALAAVLKDRKGLQWIADPATESSVDEWQRIRLRAEALQRIDVVHAPGAVSDFWLPESLALADPASTAREPEEAGEREQLERRIAAAQRIVLAPKLLVLVDDATLREQNAAANRELRTLVTRPHQGPFLLLDAADPHRACDELLAAVEAMN
jgi:2-amino-4-hydroxy-6-hydroxymethyldihydropteridine diphosphokinase